MQKFQGFFKEQPYKDYFRARKITIMGLGLLGGALNDAIFLAKCGAELTITDLKSEEELKLSLKKLRQYKNIKYVLGRHDLVDFQKADLILQPGNVPPNSPYLLEAKKNNIPIHESESLFFKILSEEFCPEQGRGVVTTIGVTGTRGKTTTTRLIYEILKSVYGKKAHLAGNIQGQSTLALLGKVRPGDAVVLELDSWCLHGLGEIKQSPNIAVFTNFMKDHLNFYIKDSQDETEALAKYFKDKTQIYLNQTKDDVLICGAKIAKRIGKVRSKKIVANKNDIPNEWKIKIPGSHNLENIACAIKVAEVLNIPITKIKKAVEGFGGVEGRLQFLRNYKGIKIYNDTTATTPEATVMALRALGGPTSHQNASQGKIKKIILIMGGADKGLNMSGLLKEIPKYCKEVILLKGTGTDKLISKKLKAITVTDNLKLAVNEALGQCRKGDILLFSPAFASFGMFKNEYDRGTKFVKIIKALK